MCIFNIKVNFMAQAELELIFKQRQTQVSPV